MLVNEGLDNRTRNLRMHRRRVYVYFEENIAKASGRSLKPSRTACGERNDPAIMVAEVVIPKRVS